MPTLIVDHEVQTAHPVYDHQDISDIGHLVDTLDRAPVVQSIADAIRGAERPRVIGVYGWWGSGKSYLLSLTIRRLLEANVNAKQQVIVCAFNPWRYEMEGDLAAGLIRALADVEQQFCGLNPPFFDPARYKSVAKGLLELVAGLGSFFGPIGETAAKLAKAIQDTTKAAQQETRADDSLSASTLPVCRVDQIKDRMEALVNSILSQAEAGDPGKEFRLAIFIDDLDRCAPSNLVRLFEWLKVHLSVKGCVYVLALDHVAAARAIVGEYKNYLEGQRDLAYGFRYLEKLVDFEYELQLAPKAELMAIRQVFPDSRAYRHLSDAARSMCGGDFPGIDRMNELLELRSLLTPRTMLKIAYRFRRALDLILGDSAAQARSLLPSGYPFWILFLVAMHYRLDPDCVDEFIRGRGIIYQLMTKAGSDKPGPWGSDPLTEFCQFADRFGASSGRTVQIPSLEVLSWLGAVVRENALPSQLLSLG